VRSGALGVALLCVSLAGPARAIETDQYFAWGTPIEDSTDILNAKVNAEIRLALEEINRRPSWRTMECRRVMTRVIDRFRGFVFHEIELWASNSPLVDRYPRSLDEVLRYREEYIYGNRGPFDAGTWIPPSPTIELHGVRVGTDKITHFFSEGWWYERWYRKALARGARAEEAERFAIDRGIFTEKTVLGLGVSGVFSTADLEANYEGMLYLLGFCDGPSPVVEKTANGWAQIVPFDFRDHVTPEWDESYQVSIFSDRRWRKVRRVLEQYCPMLRDEDVAHRRNRYAELDRVTPTEKRVAERVKQGKLSDPRNFTLESVCGTGDLSAGAPASPGP
jgi:hypothetical protein